MELPTITVEPHRARKAVAEYRRAINDRAQQELDWLEQRRLEQDRELLNTYKALTRRGAQVLSLPEAFQRAGSYENGLPRIAICRADAIKVRLHIGQDTFSMAPEHVRGWDRANHRDIRLPTSMLDVARLRTHFAPKGGRFWWAAVRDRLAEVPQVPPHLRPKRLERYHILWDATWEVAPPTDPVLLRRLGKHMFAVVAQWDLTTVERGVLFG